MRSARTRSKLSQRFETQCPILVRCSKTRPKTRSIELNSIRMKSRQRIQKVTDKLSAAVIWLRLVLVVDVDLYIHLEMNQARQQFAVLGRLIVVDANLDVDDAQVGRRGGVQAA